MKTRFLSYGCVFVGLWLSAAGALSASGVTLWLDDGTQQIHTLEIGRDLSVRVTGLAASQQVSLVLRDATGGQVAVANAMADPTGQVEVAQLWAATGIVGCDCGVVLGANRFRRAEAALQALPGEVFEVAVLDAFGNPLVVDPLPLTVPSRPVALPADASGCPRYRLQDSESLYLLVLGGTAGAQTSVTVAAGFTGPVTEVRQVQPEGPIFGLSGQTTELVLLWPGPLTTPGGYRVVAGGAGWPIGIQSGSPPINSGVLVEDHSCPISQKVP